TQRVLRASARRTLPPPTTTSCANSRSAAALRARRVDTYFLRMLAHQQCGGRGRSNGAELRRERDSHARRPRNAGRRDAETLLAADRLVARIEEPAAQAAAVGRRPRAVPRRSRPPGSLDAPLRASRHLARVRPRRGRRAPLLLSRLALRRRRQSPRTAGGAGRQ